MPTTPSYQLPSQYQPSYGSMSSFSTAMTPTPPALPPDFEQRAVTTTDRGEWFSLKRALQDNYSQLGAAEYQRLMNVLYSNPLQVNQRYFDQATSSGGGGGALSRIGHTVSNAAHNTAGAVTGLATQAPSALTGGAGDWLQHFLGTPEGRRQLATIAAIGTGSMAVTGGLGAGASAAGAGAHGGADIYGVGSGVAEGVGGAASAVGPMVPMDYGEAGVIGGLAPSEVAGNSAFIGAPGLGGGAAAATGYGAGTVDPFAAPPGGGNAFTQFMDQYGKYIGMGTSALGQYEQNRIQREEFARMQEAAEANRAAALDYAGPENYNKLYAGYEKSFQDQYKPALLNQGEALALGEQGEQERFAGDVARRNMQGSGLAQVGPQTISAGRQARYGEAVRGYYTSAADAARAAASGTQAQQIGASLGAPVPYFPKGPSTTQNVISTLGAGVGAYTDMEALQRRQEQQDAMMSYGLAPAMYHYTSP